MCVVIDLDVVCLICLQPSENMLPIFTTDADDPELKISQKISIISDIKIDQNNQRLPHKICNDCLQDLKASWRFRKNCQAAAIIFQTIVKLVQDTAPKNHAEQEIKVPHCLQIKRIVDDNEKDEKADETLIIENTSTEEHFIIENEKISGSTLFEELESNNYEDNADGTTNDFQAIEDACENDNFADENNFVEYYITDEGTTEVSTTVYQREEDVRVGNEHTDIKTYTIETSNKPVSRGRQNKRKVASSRGNTDTKSKTILNNAKHSEKAAPTQARQTRRKRKSLSPEVKKPKICELCGNSYRYQHALKAHMRRHNNDKPFPCECCDKKFVSNVELTRHMRVHTGQKPYACQYCDRRFSDFGSRIKHERTHTGERPYYCTTCGKSFAYPHVLSVHMLTHTGEKRFRCDYCAKGFTKKAYLLSHTKQHQCDIESYQLVIEDSMDNNQEREISETPDECDYTAEMASEPVDEVEECDEDNYQEKDEIKYSEIRPKMEDTNDGET